MLQGDSHAMLNPSKRELPLFDGIGETIERPQHQSDASFRIILAQRIHAALFRPIQDDSISLCGQAALSIIASRPEEVLDLAREKLHAWPYRNVPTCWRRLCEEASLFTAAKCLTVQDAPNQAGYYAAKRRRLDMQHNATKDDQSDLIGEVVRILDMGISLSGMPGREQTFLMIFEQLGQLGPQDASATLSSFHIQQPEPLRTDHQIRSSQALGFEAFQSHLDNAASPLLMLDALDHWPAMKLWQAPEHLLRLTLGGRRMVPIEIGKSYTDDDWSQQIISFKDYLHQYLLPREKEATKIGYLAQHDLFAQIPALRDDICIPDYCYTTPPSAETAGLTPAAELNEPLLNAWFGPKGTRSPLHTDPYHNILCQVVGYKYIRLYPPKETPNLYPRGTDEAGINMSNTSQVEFAFQTGVDMVDGIEDNFPNFKQACYEETVLGPGQCLYIPVGWWHFVESLSSSFSEDDDES